MQHNCYYKQRIRRFRKSKKSQPLDPLSLGINKDFAVILLMRAITIKRGTVPEDSGDSTALWRMSTLHCPDLRTETEIPGATAELEKAHAAAPKIVRSLTHSDRHTRLWVRKTSAEDINELNQPAKQNVSLQKKQLTCMRCSGEKEKAVAILQKAARTTISPSRNSRWTRALAELRKDAR